MDYLERIERQLDLPPGEREQVMRELRSHYDEIREELVASGIDAAGAEEEAARRLGQPEDIAARVRTVHMRANWKSVLLAILPFLLVGLPGAVPYTSHNLRALLIAAFGCVMVAGSVRELRKGRRPIWLATWLAAAGAAASAVGLIIVNAQSSPPDNYEYQFMARAGVWCALLLMTCWGSSPRWCVVALILAFGTFGPTALGMAWHVGPIAGLFSFMGLFLSGVGIPMLVGIRVFARHRYGTLAQVSLFLFAVLYLHVVSPGHLLSGAVVLLALLVFARASTWGQKVAALAAGVTLCAAVGRVEAGVPFHGMSSVLWVAFQATVLSLLILAPMLFDRWQRRRRLQLAR